MMQEKVGVRMDALRDEIIDLYRKHVPHVFDEVSAGRLPAPTQSLVFAMVAASLSAQLRYADELSPETAAENPTTVFQQIERAARLMVYGAELKKIGGVH